MDRISETWSEKSSLKIHLQEKKQLNNIVSRASDFEYTSSAQVEHLLRSLTKLWENISYAHYLEAIVNELHTLPKAE